MCMLWTQFPYPFLVNCVFWYAVYLRCVGNLTSRAAIRFKYLLWQPIMYCQLFLTLLHQRCIIYKCRNHQLYTIQELSICINHRVILNCLAGGEYHTIQQFWQYFFMKVGIESFITFIQLLSTLDTLLRTVDYINTGYPVKDSGFAHYM